MPASRFALLWDVDGTLLESRTSIRSTMNAVLAEGGHAPFTRAELDGLIGRPLREILGVRVPDPVVVETMVHRYRSLYNESGWVTDRFHDGVLELTERLRRRGWAIGVVTSKGQGETETLMADLGVLHLLDAVVGDDDRRPLKPDPAPVLEACRRIGVPPERAAMVGDTHFDVRSARSAGAHAVGVLWGLGTRESLLEAGAEALAADARALERHLLSWSRGIQKTQGR